MRIFKKSISFLLIFCILFSAVIIKFSTDVSAATITTMYIEGTDVCVRTGPGTTFSLIEKVDNRSATVLSQVEGNKVVNGQVVPCIWYEVTYFNGSSVVTGYVASADYIRIVTYDPDADFEDKIVAFPESYREALRALHAEYPNWEFIPEPVSTSFDELVNLESLEMRKQVSVTDQPVSWRSMLPGTYDWLAGSWTNKNGGWTGASREIIAFYMDPRNFLNSDDIYMFLQQGYDASLQTEAGVLSILEGTFMTTNYVPSTTDVPEGSIDYKDSDFGGSYVKVIMEAAKRSGVSPYVIASKIRQEIGTSGTSPLISGTYTGFENYYNFFNFNASGSTEAEVVKNGLTFAKSMGWSTRSRAIIEGAKRYSNGYINSGQDTYYYQDFNVHNVEKLNHQYAQAVHDAYSKGSNLAATYQSQKNFPLTFRIPVYPNMPEKACAQPEKSNKLNNYYIRSLSVSGLTPTFEMFKYEYSLKVTGDTTVNVAIPEKAKISSPTTVNLVAGDNSVVIAVTSETGYTTNYTILINASAACVLNLAVTTVSNGTVLPTDTAVLKGDTNGDGAITLRDLANVRLHLLGLITLEGANATGADTNGDGQIALRDLANIRLHLLGLVNLG